MNNEWALGEIDRFLKLAEKRPLQPGHFHYETVAPRDEVIQQWSVVKRIITQVLPDWDKYPSNVIGDEFSSHRDAANAARSLIAREQEIEINLEPTGPFIALQSLHETVWSSAKSMWHDGHYRAAVQTAATAVEIRIQARLQRDDLHGTALINQTFTEDPHHEGVPKLLIPSFETRDNRVSFLEGMRSLGVACMTLARNLNSHSINEISEPQALEELAMLSLFLRLSETCTLVTGISE